jgi:hypothetical protein
MGKIMIDTVTVQDPQMLVLLLEAFDREIDVIRVLANELKTDCSAHVHGGVATGAGTTDAGLEISAAAIVEQVQIGKEGRATMQYINLTTVQDPEMLMKVLEAMDREVDAIRTLVNELKTDLSEHTHGGVTADSGDTAAGATIAAAAVTEQVTRGK